MRESPRERINLKYFGSLIEDNELRSTGNFSYKYFRRTYVYRFLVLTNAKPNLIKRPNSPCDSNVPKYFPLCSFSTATVMIFPPSLPFPQVEYAAAVGG